MAGIFGNYSEPVGATNLKRHFSAVPQLMIVKLTDFYKTHRPLTASPNMGPTPTMKIRKCP